MSAEQPIADNHVHSQWSWDATKGDMAATCRRAIELGLPSIAFTEHADWVRGPGAVFDATGYLQAIERCRAAFPGLRILSGVEMGEPHRYPAEARTLLAAGFDRVLASVHGVDWEGRLTDASERGFLTPENAARVFRLYLRELLSLVESAQDFQVLAHLDYPKRYWPAEPAYDEMHYEEELRGILRAAARRGVALELNTTRGAADGRYLCPGPVVLRWWREEGGGALSFGSDTHNPDRLAGGFEVAKEAAMASGFKPADDPLAFWVR